MDDDLYMSDEDFNRPLFIDPPDDIGREDAWGGPYAFLLGGMGDPSYSEIAAEYFAAATQLVDDILQQRIEDFSVAMPILFLYRHSVELILKGAMGEPHGHELDVLAEMFSNYVKQQYQEQVPSWIMNRLKELSEIDPRSTSFRYAEKTTSKRQGTVPLGGEHFIDLIHLRRSMLALFKALERVAMFRAKRNMRGTPCSFS